MNYARRDVIWSEDPFKDDAGAGRPWLVLNNHRHPSGDEQFVTVALTTSGYDDAVSIPERAWVDGGTPRQSYVLPWAVHSPQVGDVARRQGRLTEGFVEAVVRELLDYVRAVP